MFFVITFNRALPFVIVKHLQNLKFLSDFATMRFGEDISVECHLTPNETGGLVMFSKTIFPAKCSNTGLEIRNYRVFA